MEKYYFNTGTLDNTVCKRVLSSEQISCHLLRVVSHTYSDSITTKWHGNPLHGGRWHVTSCATATLTNANRARRSSTDNKNVILANKEDVTLPVATLGRMRRHHHGLLCRSVVGSCCAVLAHVFRAWTLYYEEDRRCGVQNRVLALLMFRQDKIIQFIYHSRVEGRWNVT